MKKWFYLFLCVLAVSAFLVWHAIKSHTEKAQFRTEIIHKGMLTQTVSANGTLNPVVLVNVGTQISGRVEKIYADFNDHVSVGQVLLELDKKLLNAALQQSAAQVNKAQAALTLAKANEKRGIALKNRGFISQQDFDQLVQIRKTAEADLKLAKAQLNRDQTNLSYATIRSPVSGVVVDREVDVGQTVAASFQTPVLFEIAQDLHKMQIDSSFAEADIGNIRPGQEVFFTVDAFPDRTFTGVVKQIRLNPTIQQNVVTYDVVVLVENKDGVLLPGMTAYVNIKTAQYHDVLLVPNAAFRFHPQKELLKSAVKTKTDTSESVVYKLQNKKLVAAACQIKAADNRYTAVISESLKPGDKVAVGTMIKNQKPASAKAFRLRVF